MIKIFANLIKSVYKALLSKTTLHQKKRQKIKEKKKKCFSSIWGDKTKDLLLPFLVNVALDILTHALRQEKEMWGIDKKGNEPLWVKHNKCD